MAAHAVMYALLILVVLSVIVIIFHYCVINEIIVIMNLYKAECYRCELESIWMKTFTLGSESLVEVC